MRLLSRLARRSEKSEDGCWVWLGARNGEYGQIRGELGPDGRHVSTHRAAYLAFVGPIADGDHLHHLCGNKLCWNWEHLKPVPAREHRGEDAKRITHCPQGHAYDEVNTIIDSRGNRACRECGRARHREWNRRGAGTCADCGKQLASRTAKRCRDCHLRYARAQKGA